MKMKSFFLMATLTSIFIVNNAFPGICSTTKDSTTWCSNACYGNGQGNCKQKCEQGLNGVPCGTAADCESSCSGPSD